VSRLDGPRSALLRLPTRRATPEAVVLGYHDVVATDAEASGMTVSAAQLDAQLRTLTRLGLSIVPLEELVDRLETRRPCDAMAAITFDDALVGVHRFALDVLARHEASATIFVVTDHLGVEPPWWPGSARTLTEAELGELVDAGHRLGSHTRSHRSLPSLDHDELVAELTDSRRQLQAWTSHPVDILAYPSGHHDPTVRAAATDAGYRAAFTFLNGRIDGSEDLWKLPRLTMGPHQAPARLAYHLLRSARSWPDHQIDAVASPRPH
jgi:peptidoglycan/xylan/chitin deacetylase (PgdA/CDA1 family)